MSLVARISLAALGSATVLLSGCSDSTAPVPVASITISSPAESLHQGDTVQLSVTARDEQGNVLANRSLQWSSSDSAIAHVDSHGSVTALSPGAVTISATADGAAGELALSIIFPAPRPGYNIDAWFIGDVSPRLRASVADAITFLQSVIRNDEPDEVAQVPAGQCWDEAPALDQVLDDLVVYVEVADLTEFSGRTTICFIRSEDSLPVVARVRINRGDLDRMFREGWGDKLVLHELTHAVGMSGGTWRARGLVDGADSDDPVFTGSAARAAFMILGGSTDSATAVPIENVGPSGTIGTHWRQSVLNGEIMTHLVSPTSAFSLITVSALQDLGYEVDRSRAEPFRVHPSGADLVRSAGVRVSDRVDPPIGTIARDGTVRPLEH